MKSRFSRPTCWFLFLFCLACDARGDNASPAARQKSERGTTTPTQAQGSENKPVVVDTERIRGNHEYEAQRPSGAELRGAPTTSAGQAPDGAGQIEPKQDYTPSAGTTKTGGAAAASKTETGNKENQPNHTGIEGIAERHGAHEIEPQLRRGTTSPGGIASPSAKDRSKMAVEGSGKPGFAETEHIRGHLEQPSDMKLRLGGEMEPDTDLKVAVPGPEKVSPRSRPVFVAADRLQGHSDREVEAIGRAELNNGE
jgi:LPS-assembly protein